MSTAWSKQIWLFLQRLYMRKTPTNLTCSKTKTSFGSWPSSAALITIKRRRQRVAVCISCSNANSAWLTSLVRSKRILSYFGIGFAFTETLTLRCLLWPLLIHCFNFQRMHDTPRSSEDSSQISRVSQTFLTQARTPTQSTCWSSWHKSLMRRKSSLGCPL